MAYPIRPIGLRHSLRNRLLRLLDHLLPPPKLSSSEELERRMIVGTVAEASPQLAESARLLLGVQADIRHCRELIQRGRRLFTPKANGRSAIELPRFCRRGNPAAPKRAA